MKSKCDNRLAIELLFSGELNKNEAERVSGHIDECKECSAFFSALKTQKEAFLSKHPFSSFTQAHAPLKQLPWYKNILSPSMRPVLLPVLGALILSVSLLPSITGYRNPTNQGIRFKGKSSIGYLYKRDGNSMESGSSDRFRKGDQIQIFYSSPKKQFLAIASLDATGTVSFYDGDRVNGSCSIPITEGNRMYYPSSIELDDSQGSELVVALFTDVPLSASEIEGKLKTLFSQYKELDAVKKRIVGNQDVFKAQVEALLLIRE